MRALGVGYFSDLVHANFDSFANPAIPHFVCLVMHLDWKASDISTPTWSDWDAITKLRMSLLWLPQTNTFESRTSLELQQVYFVISSRIGLSGDASGGLGDPFCFGFFPKEKHNKGEGSKKAKKTKQRTKKYKEHRTQQRRRNNEWKHTKRASDGHFKKCKNGVKIASRAF